MPPLTDQKSQTHAKDLIALPEALAISNGAHSDPFAVLGGHETKAGFLICIFDPGADSMSVMTGDGTAVEMTPVAGATGVFTCLLDRRIPYRLRGAAGDVTWEFEDPFRFGPVIGAMDEHFISEGTHRRLWQSLGAHPMAHEGVDGVHFAVWAPNARRVSVVGPFNNWDGRRHPMRRRGTTGVWEIFLPALTDGIVYCYEIIDSKGRLLPLKADPVGFGAEHAPRTGSVVRDLRPDHWTDEDWMAQRGDRQTIQAPISIYEVHLGSWRRVSRDGNRSLSYRELAEQLIDYVAEMGFTHLELLPVSEFPFEGSWGYQPIGLYAPTSRYGTPEEFRALINAAHRRGLGVILDWVPAHFPTDPHGLGQFDGTALYEYQDPREGLHQDWNTLIFNFGRSEVLNYLIANAIYWLKEHHVDGLRVDAVASMLYRDYSRKDGEWIPNRHGGRENLEAIQFLKQMNEAAYGENPGIMTIAEESTAFPAVSKPTDAGGLGFGFKWNMGWMHDTLDYIRRAPVYRKHHHHQVTFGLSYAFSENFVLPISHDEVVHGKGSMIGKMPGEGWEQFANLRAYYGFMWTHPGKKLIFMGCEFAQVAEWNHDAALDWHLLDHPLHRGIQDLIRALNRVYQSLPALHVRDCKPEGFEWINSDTQDESVFSFVRFGFDTDAPVVVVCNFAPVQRDEWRIGLPRSGRLRLVLNSDADQFGGGDRGQFETADIEAIPWDGRPWSAVLTLPPLATLILKLEAAQ